MTPSPGIRIGPYEITKKLGAGGMGEVYRARDTRLGRDVAIKVLPQDAAKDEDRIRRFELEARAAGTLNHPNVLTIFDIGSHEGTLYVVSEVLDGATLGEEIRNGPLPVRKVVDYAGQLARGLAAAHEKGIFHRDLKPDNVFVTTDGRVKILDFGLAKLSERIADASRSTMQTMATEPGMVLGTVGYMSPEQVRGHEVDHRSDIFSFGAVLYEMITGRRAFIGESSVETMNAILKEDPPELPDNLRLNVPPELDRIVRHCLEKKPEQRFQSARDLAFGLEALSTRSGPGSAVIAAPVISKARNLRLLAIAAAIVFVVAAAVLASRWFIIPTPQTSWSGVLLGGPEIAMYPRISPDGKTLAFLAMINNQTQVAVMDPIKGNWTVLTQDRTRGAAHAPAWSPDGSRIYFERYFANFPKIFSIAVLGGEERPVLENAYDPLPLPDGSLLVTIPDADRDLLLYRFWPETGKRDPMGPILATESAHLSRDGRHVLFFGRLEKKAAPPRLYELDIASGKAKLVNGRTSADTDGLATDDSRGSWLTIRMSGDLFRIIRFSTDGKTTKPDELMALTQYQSGLDAGPDGSIYVDQLTRPQEVIRFSLSGGIPERLVFNERVTRDQGGSLLLSDGRILTATQFSGHLRLVAGRPGDRLFPFVETSDYTTLPAALVGDDQIACLIGSSAGSQTIAIVSTVNGQVIRRLNGAVGKTIDSIAASPDGKTLYFAGARTIWSIPVADGEPRKLAVGDGVAPSPDGQYLIIQIVDKDRTQLAKLPMSGGEPQPIRLDLGGFRLWVAPLSPNAVAADGRIIHAVDSPDSWFETAAVIDPRTGHVERIPTTFSGDIHGPSWTKDGKVIATGLPTQSSLWHFVPSSPR